MISSSVLRLRYFLPLLISCSAPPPPKIPPRDLIGPPREAAIECSPPYQTFAQSQFRIADLDRGKSCTAFLEQDECILAIFRDCTFDASPSRSWRGAIDSDKRVRLDATYESPAIGTRVARSCSGILQLPRAAGEPAWSRLACQIPAGADQRPHAGFYFERVDPMATPPFMRDGTTEVLVAMPQTAIDDFVSDFVVLSRATQIWALVNAGAADPATGLYAGPLRGPRLAKQDLSLQTPALIRATEDESAVYIADGAVLHRISTTARPAISSPFAGRIIDVAVRETAVFVASSMPPRQTRLSAHDPDSLEARGSIAVDGIVSAIIPVSTVGATTALVLTFEGPQLALITPSLTSSRSLNLEIAPRGHLWISGTIVGLSASGTPGRYIEVDYASPPDATGRARVVLDVVVPDGGEIRSLLYDAQHDQVLAGTRTGLLSVIDRAGQRALLGSALQLPSRAPVNQIRWGSGPQIAYALSGTPGVIYPLLRGRAR